MKKISSIECELEKDDTLYFLHIPKTAGTSLVNIIENNFLQEEIYPEVIWPELFKKLPKDFSKFKLIRGHFGFWIYKLLPKIPVTITMLRNPIDQSLSLYAHQLRAAANNEDWLIVKKQNESLDEILDDQKKREMFANHQIRHLTLEVDVKLITKIISEKKQVNQKVNFKQFAKFFTLYKKSSKEIDYPKLLEIAKERIIKIPFFGISEKFEESLYLLFYLFGWYPVFSFSKLNISSNRKNIDELPIETSRKLKEFTKFDTELYQFASAVFEKRFSQMVDELKKKYHEPKYDKMNFKDMMYDMLVKHYFDRNPSSRNFVSTLQFDFGQKMIGYGWDEKEIANEIKFRWTSQEESAVFFPLSNKSDLNIDMVIVNQISSDVLKSLKLLVSDTQIDLKRKQSRNFLKSNHVVFEGIVSKSLLENNKFTEFKFQTSKISSPLMRKLISKDSRKLGLAFHSINFSPLD